MAYLLIWICIALASLSAIVALSWALKSGQFADMNRASRSIFDDDASGDEGRDIFPSGGKT